MYFSSSCFKAVLHPLPSPSHSPCSRLIFTYRGCPVCILKRFTAYVNSGRTQAPPPKKKILFSPQEASLGRPDWVFTRRCQVRVYTGLVPPPKKKSLKIEIIIIENMYPFIYTPLIIYLIYLLPTKERLQRKLRNIYSLSLKKSFLTSSDLIKQ